MLAQKTKSPSFSKEACGTATYQELLLGKEFQRLRLS